MAKSVQMMRSAWRSVTFWWPWGDAPTPGLRNLWTYSNDYLRRYGGRR